jgi:hypothetical protein
VGDIRWDLLGGPIDVGSQVQQGFATGMALTKRFQTQHALSAYMQNPDDPQAFNALASVDPQAAATLQESRRAQRKEQEERWAIGRRTALGQLYTQDPAAARQEALAAGDFDLAKTFADMDNAGREKTAKFWGMAGSVAFRLKQEADPARRAAIWGEARPILEANGAPRDMLDRFNPTNDAQLDAAISTAQTVGQVADQFKVTWHQQGEQPSFATDSMGRPVGNGNPYASGGGAAVPPPPPGFQIVDDGGPTASPSGTFPRRGGGLTIERNNNPGALRVPGSMRFQRFNSPAEGVAAQEGLLQRYHKRGLNTVASVIERYAPRASRGGDNTDAQVNNYIGYVSKRLGVNPNAPLSPAAISDLARAMREFETGRRTS